MYPRCCLINFGFYSSTLVDKEPRFRKTDKQIIKWLKNPHTDSAEYKMWGNGIALPCAIFIFKRLVNIAKLT